MLGYLVFAKPAGVALLGTRASGFDMFLLSVNLHIVKAIVDIICARLVVALPNVRARTVLFIIIDSLRTDGIVFDQAPLNTVLRSYQKVSSCLSS